MLGFLRKYQQFFYIIITVVIVISFSFFGTYSTLDTPNAGEQVAFVAIDGTPISRSDLDEMVVFIGTDMEDKRLFGGSWGPNFLNNGIVREDILSTGIGASIAKAFPHEIKEDLNQRHTKEKNFTLYTHPQAKFLGIETAWTYFAPQMSAQFKALQKAKDPVDDTAFNARVALFLGEKRIPAPMLRQVLTYQEKQYNWLSHDPNLDRTDLSLFGYHTLEDWFGPRFLRLSAEYLINAAKIAEQHGYQVSKDEALADLMHNAAISFEQNAKSPYLGVSTSTQYFDEQLRRMRMDRTTAVKLWRQVMLARRLFHDMGSAVVVDPATFKPFVEYAGETTEGTVYQLPEALHIGNAESLQKFEAYTKAVGKDNKGPLDLPKVFKTADELAKTNPELVQRRYALQVSEVTKANLQTRVGIKETWEWEADEANWKALQKQFPELGIKKGATREERVSAVDSLDNVTRAKVDSFARSAIVNTHPDWINDALSSKEPKTIVVGLSTEGVSFPFEGVSDRSNLIALLNAAPIAGTTATPEAEAASKKLQEYSGDGEHIYRIRVMNRAADPEVMTFSEAQESGASDAALQKALKTHYEAIKEKNPQDFQNPDKSWKNFSEAANSVGGHYVAELTKALGKDYVEAMSPAMVQKDVSTNTTNSLRFFKHLRETQAKFLSDPDAEAEQVLTELPPVNQSTSPEALPTRTPLADQWKLTKTTFKTSRSQANAKVSSDAAQVVDEGKWSTVVTQPNGDLYFFKVMKKMKAAAMEEIAEQTNKAHSILGLEAQGKLGQALLLQMKEKGALSLDYMNRNSTEMEPTEQVQDVQGTEG